MLRPDLAAKMAKLPELSCNGCKKCCEGDTIFLDPVHDDPNDFEVDELQPNVFTLKKGEDGNCIYLGEHGCTTHLLKPRMCTLMDCRLYFLATDTETMDVRLERYQNPLKGPVLKKGKELIESYGT